MRERLIDLIDGFRELDAPQDGRSWTEHLTDHLLANGVIVQPVKVGQTVYYPNESGYIYECDVFFATYVNLCGIEDIRFETKHKSPDFKSVFHDNDFGKTVFLTKEEAERALAERSKS